MKHAGPQLDLGRLESRPMSEHATPVVPGAPGV